MPPLVFVAMFCAQFSGLLTSGLNVETTRGLLSSEISIDISDERSPRVVSTFKPDVNKPENCAQNIATNTSGGMVHYLNFDDRYNMRLVVYASSNQGIRVVDFRDPEHPKEIAYYLKERHVAANAAPATLFPNYTTGSTAVDGTDFTRPDPRYDLENCFWYTGWNQGG